jgi:hypothetical protein
MELDWGKFDELLESTEVNSEVYIKEYIKDLDRLENIMPNIEYYVLGGFPLAINEKTTVNDIDVFFPSIEELVKTISALEAHFELKKTAYAYTFYLDGRAVQLIHSKFGTVEEVMDTFDLNKSKSGWVINNGLKKYVKSPDYDKDLHIIFDNFQGDTIQRYFKYLNKLGIEENEKNAKDLIKFIYENKHKKYKRYYGDSETSKDYIMLLKEYLDDNIRYVDIVTDIFGVNESYKIFSKIYTKDKTSARILTKNTKNPVLLTLHERFDEVPDDFKIKYPQYFI